VPGSACWLCTAGGGSGRGRVQGFGGARCGCTRCGSVNGPACAVLGDGWGVSTHCGLAKPSPQDSMATVRAGRHIDSHDMNKQSSLRAQAVSRPGSLTIAHVSHAAMFWA
jgi:hypothetical protein